MENDAYFTEGLWAACITEFPVSPHVDTAFYPCVHTYMAIFFCLYQVGAKCAMVPVKGRLYALSILYSEKMPAPEFLDYVAKPPFLSVALPASYEKSGALSLYLKKDELNYFMERDVTRGIPFTFLQYPSSLLKPTRCSRLVVRNVTITLNDITDTPKELVLWRYISLVTGC
ncbi:ORF45 [Ranid herpesvirus 2]|uniref:ORF45 n=1 Tax=Ranid herpesvirus 2 TaxID=389214 RepID=Q14W61_9VIRU|nr:ORF45 [Ranid herpesvirus 2]ABG25690.1 ORF45 [Ranid herpesvirus 2]